MASLWWEFSLVRAGGCYDLDLSPRIIEKNGYRYFDPASYVVFWQLLLHQYLDGFLSTVMRVVQGLFCQILFHVLPDWIVVICRVFYFCVTFYFSRVEHCTVRSPCWPSVIVTLHAIGNTWILLIFTCTGTVVQLHLLSTGSQSECLLKLFLRLIAA